MNRRASRGVLVLLAVVLNGLPWLRQNPHASTGAQRFVLAPPVVSRSSVPYFQTELVNPQSPLPMSHVASLCQLPNGRLAVTWYSGSREGAQDVAIFLATQVPGETNWSSPRPIMTREKAAADLGRAINKVGNAVIFPDAAGRLQLLFVTITLGGWSGSSLNLATSTDQGVSWSRSQRLTLSPFFNLSELVKNGPIGVSAGGIVLPIYHELIGKFPELLWMEGDDPVLTATKTRIFGGRTGFQPALVALTPTSALTFVRDCGSARKISISRSQDAGKNWSAPVALELPNPDAGLAALRLADGRLLLVFNDSVRDRANLRLAISSDNGFSWQRVSTLAEEPGAEFSYPFLSQTQEGNVQLVYTWKRRAIRHVVFNPPWLDAQIKANPK